MNEFLFSKHAEEQMLKRGNNREQVLAVVYHPDKIIVNDGEEIVIFQSIIKEEGGLYLLRVFVNSNKHPMVIVTLYKTTKIAKYHEGEIR
jgi:hypothetical protein